MHFVFNFFVNKDSSTFESHFGFCVGTKSNAFFLRVFYDSGNSAVEYGVSFCVLNDTENGGCCSLHYLVITSSRYTCLEFRELLKWQVTVCLRRVAKEVDERI